MLYPSIQPVVGLNRGKGRSRSGCALCGGQTGPRKYMQSPSVNPHPKPGKQFTSKPTASAHRIGQFYLDLTKQRLFFLNKTAKRFRSEGIPITAADLAERPLRTHSGELVTEDQLPLTAAMRSGRPVEESFFLLEEGKPPVCVTWSAAPRENEAGEMVGVYASLCCTLPEPDWQGLAGL